ncbi:MAG TPA: NUDIX hydrolase [Burkholderiaceae bacterium]|nr:NUDIX hydrolase [Burkholderiaceae bacterium]
MPSPWKPSVTVAAIVERDGRFLMVEEQTSDGIRLNQPAGHLDPGESLVDAAIRETLEETTCTFAPQALLGVYMARSGSAYEAGPVTYVRFAFTGTVGEPDNALKLDHGIQRALWLTADEIRARAEMHRSPLVMKCIEDHLAGQRYPLSVVHTHPSAVA